MTDLTPQQIKKAVLRGLKEVGDRFAKDPRPTDGSVRSALAAAARKAKPQSVAESGAVPTGASATPHWKKTVRRKRAKAKRA